PGLVGLRGALVLVLLVGLVAHVVAAAAFGTIQSVRLVLPERRLRRGNHAEIMLGVLVVVFGRYKVAGRLRVARKLQVFLRNMRRGPANFDVGPVRLVDPRQRIVVAAFAVTPPHALVLTVSHGCACSPTPSLRRRCCRPFHSDDYPFHITNLAPRNEAKNNSAPAAAATRPQAP